MWTGTVVQIILAELKRKVTNYQLEPEMGKMTIVKVTTKMYLTTIGIVRFYKMQGNFIKMVIKVILNV